MKPPFRWVGSKRRLVKEIAAHFPEGMTSYAEPFVGSGAVMLELIRQGKLVPEAKIYINDLSPVVDFWRCVSEPEYLQEFIGCLKSYRPDPECSFLWAKDLLDHYYPPERAAAFLVLNQLSFNGLFRRNRKGKFNVPRDPSKTLRDRTTDLLALAGRLADFEVHVGPVPDSRECQNYYFDPPYDGKTFTAYGAESFGPREQRFLADACFALAYNGARVVASNADTPRVRELYEGFQIFELKRANNLSAKASTRREQRGELLMVRR